jgi:PEP-CTERM motif
MRKRLLMLGAVLAAVVTAGPVGAATLTVDDLGTVMNDSVSFPPVDTSPGMNTDFFEFELPTTQFVSASLSISGPEADQLTGTFNLNHWTSTGTVAPFVPMGALIESAAVTPHAGGETAVVGTFTPTGDLLAAGNYFVEVEGNVPVGAKLSLAVDGNVTGVAAVPEPSTWAMMAIGFGLLGFAGRRRVARHALSA